MANLRTAVLVALAATGCATSSSLKQQIDPLTQRVAALEKQQAGLQAQLAELTARAEQAQGQQDGTQRQLADVTAKLDALREELSASSTVARSAEQAASEARAATIRAEVAATKAAKAFELTQKRAKR